MGLYYAQRLYKRAAWLRAAESMLCVLEDKLAFSAAPLSDLWRSMADSPATAHAPLVATTAAGLAQGQGFEAAFRAAVDEAQAAGWLTPTERECLDALAASLGRGDLAMQTAGIRRCREGLSRVADAALALARSRGAVYRMAGLSGGVCVALVLL